MSRGPHIDVSIPEQLNLATYFLEENLVKGRGNRVAIYYRDKEYTFNDLSALTNRIGNVLKELGVGLEDRVLLVLQDSPEWVASWYAIMKIGAIGTHAYTYLHPDDYEYFLNYVRPSVVIADQTTLDSIRQGARGSKFPKATLVISEDPPELYKGEYSLNKMLSSADAHLEAEPVSKNDIALWNFSGGTTGKSKAVPHMHHDGVIGFESFQYIVKYTEDDLVLRIPKLFFHYARDLGMNFALRAGAAVVLFPERTTAKTIFEIVDKYRPTVLINVPTMMRAMLQIPEAERSDFSCVRLNISSGEPLSPQLYKEFTETFGVEVLNCIGSAETYLGYLMDRPGEVVPGSSGKLTPLVEVKVVDKERKEVPKGEAGVLWVRSDASGWCYHLDHEKSKKTFLGDDWVNTNDLFKEDKNGYFWYSGRADDLIKVSGVYVAPLEIEKCLHEHPAVRECAVLGLEDADGLVKTKAFITLKEKFKASEKMAEELKKFCKQKLASYKSPKVIEFMNELPKTGQGKIDKRKLRDRGLYSIM